MQGENGSEASKEAFKYAGKVCDDDCGRRLSVDRKN
jgi:hypothetical protein